MILLYSEKEKQNGDVEGSAAGGGSDGEKKSEENGEKEKRFMMLRRKFEFTKEIRYKRREHWTLL